MAKSTIASSREQRPCYHITFYYVCCGHHTVLSICRQVSPDREGQYSDTFNICTATCPFLYDMNIWATKSCPWCTRAQSLTAAAARDTYIHPRQERSDARRDHIPPDERAARLTMWILRYIDMQAADKWLETKREILWEVFVRHSEAIARAHPVDVARQVFFAGGPVPSGCEQRKLLRPLGREEQAAMPADEICPICRDGILTDFSCMVASRLPCRHFFHEECVMPWIREYGKCPYCRQELNVVHYAKLTTIPIVSSLLGIASQSPALSVKLP